MGNKQFSMSFFNIFLVILVRSAFGHQHEHFPICQQLENVFSTLCSSKNLTTSIAMARGFPGKKGETGSKGEVGDPGPVGPPGIVDHERLGTQIDTKLQPVVDQQAIDTRGLMLKIERLEEKIQTLESREGACDVKYNNKCFWVVSFDHWVQGYDNLARLCLEKNGSPANIYSKEHYDIMMRYLRSKIFAGKDFIASWIGMKTNPKTKAVTFSDGTPAPFMQWYPGYPSGTSTYTHMTIVQRSPTSSSGVGMHNYPPAATRDGVLCEI